MALVHAASGQKVHLALIDSMSEDSKTSALVKTDDFEAIHLILRSGTTIPSHAVDGYVTFYCQEGAVVLASHDTIELQADDWVYLGRGEKYELRAIDDSSLLLTIHFDKR